MRSFLPLRAEDIRLCALAISPTYVLEAAREHGRRARRELEGALPWLEERHELPLGAYGAFRETRRMVRTLVQSILKRERGRGGEDRARQEVRRTYEALGFMWRYQRVSPLQSPSWRTTAGVCWDYPEPISDLRIVKVPFDRAKRAELHGLVRLATIRTVSEALRAFPEVNRALLPGRGEAAVWQRQSGEIMVHVGLGPDQVRPIVLDASAFDLKRLQHELWRRYRRVLEIGRHPLIRVGDQLLRQWIRAGFLASPAGAMLSDAGGLWQGEDGIPTGCWEPTAVLVPGNGVPVALAIGALRWQEAKRRVAFGLRVTFDHRALDASQAKNLYRHLETRIPQLVGETLFRSERLSLEEQAELAQPLPLIAPLTAIPQAS